MASKLFIESLRSVYHGEQLGEAVFEVFVGHAADAEQRYVMGTLLQLETEGKARLRPALSRLGLALDTDVESRRNGTAGAESLLELSWTGKFEAMAASIRVRGLPQYEELGTLITEDEDPELFSVARFMGAHERAILAASENIATGEPDPLAPVIELLSFPLTPPNRTRA